MPCKVAVIIPFYQREEGILARSLASVLSQEGLDPFRVIVVDDASPRPALQELEKLPQSDRNRISLVKRPNGGPSAARNTGLDCVEAEIEYVAFLDSDDEWHPDHLARALSVLEQGFDFYFSDYRPLGSSETVFKLTGFEQSAHTPLGEQLTTFRFDGEFSGRLLDQDFVGTGTVVYRYRRFPDLRFPEELYAWEDNYLWNQIALRSGRFAFSSAEGMVCGTGVNISSSKWGSNEALRRLCSELKYRKWVRQHLTLTPVQIRETSRLIQSHRLHFISTALYRICHRLPFDSVWVREFFKADPLAVFRVLPAIPGAIWSKAVRFWTNRKH